MKSVRFLPVAVALSASLATPAAGDARILLRMSTTAPQGTAWAHELTMATRDLVSSTGGQLDIKWYWGSVAGTEIEVGERIERGQLDGATASQMLCAKISPSLNILRMPGLFQTRDEAAYVMNRLEPQLEKEAHASGYTLLGTTGLGPDILFSRSPIRTMAEMRAQRLWRWDLDEVAVALNKDMGLNIVTTPLEDARQAYEDGRLDGFLAIPTAALAFEWSSDAKYVANLPTAYLAGCMVVANRAFERLSPSQQAALRATASETQARFEELGARQDADLMDGVFTRHGLNNVPVSDSFRAEFLAAAATTRARLGDKLVRKELIDEVTQMLADYHKEHGQAR